MFQQRKSIDTPIPIAYEDKDYIVFDKPPGLLVIPTPKREQRTLQSIVNRDYVSVVQAHRLYPCHRLDRETSGLILFAKGKRNQQLMRPQFARQMVKKKYIALIHGRPKHPQGEIRSFIKDFDQKRYQKKSPARLAVTQYKVLEIKRNFSIVEVSPLTGRTNQIRIHFSEAGCPLVGERKYAFARDFTLRFKRVALHAAQLQWRHPINHQRVNVTSPLPKDMEDFIDKN